MKIDFPVVTREKSQKTKVFFFLEFLSGAIFPTVTPFIPHAKKYLSRQAANIKMQNILPKKENKTVYM